MPDDARIRVVGVPAAVDFMDKFTDRAVEAMAGALREIGEEGMLRSKPLVPVKTGNLRSTGVAQPVVREGDKLTETLSYGGTAGVEAGGVYVGYALYVHENLQAHHTNGQAKFLEQPLLEMQAEMPEMLAEGLRARLGMSKGK